MLATAPTRSMAPARHLSAASAVPAPSRPARYNGPRIMAADFFTRARTGRARTTLPPFRNGDSVSCPRGNEWTRYDGQWIIPGQPGGLALTDRTVASWWRTRHTPASQFALVHRLTTDETDLITGDHYTSTFDGWSEVHGVFSYREPVSGTWLRAFAREATRTHTVSVHLELPTGIVTLHSRREGDVFFHPASAAAPALCA